MKYLTREIEALDVAIHKKLSHRPPHVKNHRCLNSRIAQFKGLVSQAYWPKMVKDEKSPFEVASFFN